MAEYIVDADKIPPVARDLILREADGLDEVVRCRDCKHYDGYSYSGYCSVNGSDVLVRVLAGGFCNYGVRRKDS